ncbi:MAG: RHS repeat-associated core domain-containing protein [Francisellaceae bacterium]
MLIVNTLKKFKKWILIFFSVFFVIMYADASQQSDVRYFLSDGKSNVAELGWHQLGHTYNYDAYGLVTNDRRDLLSVSSSKGNTFGYNKEYQEPQIALLYLRSRFYDEHTRRFLVADTKRDEWNKYGFGGANPVMNIDPSGHTIVEEFFEFASEILPKMDGVVAERDKILENAVSVLRNDGFDDEAEKMLQLHRAFKSESQMGLMKAMHYADNIRAGILGDYGINVNSSVEKINQALVFRGLRYQAFSRLISDNGLPDDLVKYVMDFSSDSKGDLVDNLIKWRPFNDEVLTTIRGDDLRQATDMANMDSRFIRVVFAKRSYGTFKLETLSRYVTEAYEELQRSGNGVYQPDNQYQPDYYINKYNNSYNLENRLSSLMGIAKQL